MMKSKILTAMFAMVFAIVYSCAQAGTATAADPVGTWKYAATDAPYEYSTGDMIINMEEGKLGGAVKVNYQTIPMRDLKLEDNTVIFGVYIEGEYIKISLDMDGDKFSGKASYSEGTIPLSGERVKK